MALLLGAGALAYATYPWHQSPEEMWRTVLRSIRGTTSASPPAIPAPEPSASEETLSLATPASAEGWATPARELMPIQESTPASAAEALAWLTENRVAWPKEVTLLTPTHFDLVVNGVQRGAIEATPGIRLTVRGIETGYINVAIRDAAKRLPISATDLAARAPELMRAYLARQEPAAAAPVLPAPAPTLPVLRKEDSGRGLPAAAIDADAQKSSDFESGKTDPIHPCTVQKPNYAEVVARASEHLAGAPATGLRCLKFFWTEKGYNGTRMRRGSEACVSLDTYKEGWSGFYLYLPDPGYPTTKEAACAQIFQKGRCNSWGATLEIKKNALWVNHRHYCGDPVTAKVAREIPRNRWIPIIIHFVASHQRRGTFQVWFDKAPKGAPNYNARNIDFGFGDWNEDDTLAQNSPISPKWGQYNFADKDYTTGETRTSYYDNLAFVVGHPVDGWELVNPELAPRAAGSE